MLPQRAVDEYEGGVDEVVDEERGLDLFEL